MATVTTSGLGADASVDATADGRDGTLGAPNAGFNTLTYTTRDDIPAAAPPAVILRKVKYLKYDPTTGNQREGGVADDLILDGVKINSYKVHGFVAAEYIEQGSALKISGTMQVINASATSPANGRVFGFSDVLTNGGSALGVITSGFVKPRMETAQLWTVGATLYLSQLTPGTVTDTPPNTPGQIIQKVGYAVGVNTLYIAIGEPVVVS